MSTLSLEQTISEIATQQPSSMRVFETLHIDYCCGGKRSLAEACERGGLALDSVVKLLDEAALASIEDNPKNWASVPLPAVIDEIVNRHHAFVRREIPRLNSLAQKVANRHGSNHPAFIQIQAVFHTLGEELSLHLAKEEQILFPYIKSMADNGARRSSCFATVHAPIANMVAEHEDAGALLEQLRRLTGQYQVPPDGCGSVQALYLGLADFERDLHQHIHLDNAILFPRAVDMERA